MSLRKPCACVLAAALFVAAGCEQPWEELTDVADERFQATLSGANEVPAVTTTATGTAVFAVAEDTFLIYRVDVAGINAPTLAHIHDGAAGVIGGVIVTLRSGSALGANYTGVFGMSQLRASQLTQLPTSYGATPLDRLNELLARMRVGTVYVNVHSTTYPGGELRGQIQPR